MSFVTPQLFGFLTGLAAIIGASVAVSLGHIDTATYIAIIGPIAGVGVGAGVHASGVSTQTASPPSAGTTP